MFPSYYLKSNLFKDYNLMNREYIYVCVLSTNSDSNTVQITEMII